MKLWKRFTALFLVLTLVVACFPSFGAVTAFAAENGETIPYAVIEDTPVSELTEETLPEDSISDEVVCETTPTEDLPIEKENTEETSAANTIPEETLPEGVTPYEPEEPMYTPDMEEILMELFPDGNIPEDLDWNELLSLVELLGGSSGSNTGDAGGGGNAAGSGSSNMVAAGVTMQVVYYRYDESYNRTNSHANVVNTLKTGNAIPWNSTGKDNGTRSTTIFDTFTISSNTFLVKAQWNSYPYVYHFPSAYLKDDGCTFTWAGFTNYWFNYNNPGGQPGTSPYIVRNESGGSYAIEQFLARIILGNSYGAWDKLNIAAGETVATDSSLYASVLKYLGVSNLAVQNYLDAYHGKLSIAQDGSTLIPTIIWSWVGAEALGITNRLYTIGDVAKNGSTIRNYERSKQAERSQNNDERTDLHQERGFLDSEYRADRERTEAPGQIRQDAEGISGTEQPNSLQRLDSDGEAVPAPEGDRRDRQPQSGATDEPVSDGESRSEQGNGADGMGAAHEQAESTGRGSGADGAYQQLTLNLFLSETEQIKYIDEAESRKPSAFSFTQEQIGNFLVLGGNTHNHRLMVALEYAKGKTTDEIVERLKEIYHGSNGYRMDGNDLTAWFDEQCIHLAKGKTARYANFRHIVSWHEAAERIGQLMDRGEFATNVELVEAISYERQTLAESLWYLYGDLAEGIAEGGVLASLAAFRGSFLDATAALAEKLADPAFRATLQDEYRVFMALRQGHPNILRFNYHKPLLIQKRLNELDLPLREYHSDRMTPPLTPQFITDDEINQTLTSGSSFEGGKGRIWNFWQGEHSAKEKADFLKNEYGIGGRSHALSGANQSGEDYDGKGLHYKKAGCEDVKFSWPQVASRIDSLIANGRYLTESEKAQWDSVKEAHEEPELVVTDSTENDEWQYQVGDTAYLDDTASLVEQITNNEVQLRDPTMVYPIFRAENRSRFEEMLSIDDRNSHLRKRLEESDSDVVKSEIAHRYQVVAYHHFENGFDEKFDYQDLEEAERAAQGYVDGTMESDGFRYDGAAVFDLQERKHLRIYGDYPDEDAHAQVAPEIVESAQVHFLDHFYVVDNLQAPALSIKEYSSFEDALRAYHSLPSTQLKALGAMNAARPLPGSLDFVQCKDGQDTIVEDYKTVPGWENSEVCEVISRLETAIQTQTIPNVPASNYHITDDHIGEGGPKQKFTRNIEAIQTLFQLERENRNATPEEQEVLANYVGWGGLADAFDPDKSNWSQEYTTLKELLSEDEYAAARASTLNAHYTSPTVIRAIYDAVGQIGFETGNVLEPAMGIGNFFGMMPPEMQNSRLYGVELDSITGRIAQKLYPHADIKVAGFETTDRRDFFDLAVGNVPFGNYRVSDKPYDKLGFSIHNYFFAKALDQVRPGGVIAFVTSRYTMDSKNSDARRYMAQRADLLGAIRLPNDAFKKNAGTEVVSDIIFLQKRDHPIDIVPSWVDLNRTEDGLTMNSYFVDHPEMIMGELTTESTQYGKEDLTVIPRDGADLGELLKEAISRIQGSYQAVELPEVDSLEIESKTIPAHPNVKNFSYAVVDGEVYFRENSIMRHVELNEKAKERVMGMVELRCIVNDLIEYQLEDFPDEMIQLKQYELNAAYDAFTAQNGLINNRANGQAFSDDSSYYLLCSLENVDEDGNLKSKADMFIKRTIKPERRVTSVDTPSEALAISIGEHGKVDLPYMANLLGTPDVYDTIISELRGVIFKDPMAPDEQTAGWQTADEYLSGDVRSKLRVAQLAANRDSSFTVNVQALEKAQPKDLDASEIDVRLGATWIDPGYIQQFMQETFDTPFYLRRSIEVKFSDMTAEWRINGKSAPSYNDVAAYTTYGTDRANAYRILEETLNLKDIRIYDTIEDPDGKQRRVLNKKETTLAQQKQQAIKDAFRDWIWKDPHRREALVTQYNELFNSTRPREYDGSHIRFGGMNPDISLREHQRNAIAHVLYGGNTLLAHEVGAGKTFEMAASAMESKRLGLSQKAMFVVPNHLTIFPAQRTYLSNP